MGNQFEGLDNDGNAVSTPALNCIVNLRIENGGIIRANYSDTANGATGTAAITIEDDAIFFGTIATVHSVLLQAIKMVSASVILLTEQILRSQPLLSG